MSYTALYRKFRPDSFQDVKGQDAIVRTLKNQIRAQRIGHAYLFCGTRGTGKTTVAKILAKAVNCEHPIDGNPCNECETCKAIAAGNSMNVIEIDAASNNGVDNIREIREEVAYSPTSGKYKVYIIDEVHMLSTAAFNALLKTMEEPPEHVIFILATTEVQKVPVTILSRCQRYDFTRITADDIAGRLLYVAWQEKIELDENAAQLIGRLADGAMRDALSILDTCAGVTAKVDADVVRRMAGVTDRSYLFRISDAIAAQDAPTALAQLAQLRQQSVDVKRLTEELIAHYRALMLAALPGGQTLLSGVSPEEETCYLEKGPQLGQKEAIRAIRTLGNALEHMTRGSDQRIELELALFSLSEPPQMMQRAAVEAAPRPAAPQETPRPFAAAASPQPFVSVPVAPAASAVESAAPVTQTAPETAAPASMTDPEPQPEPLVKAAPAEDDLPPLPEEPPVQDVAPLPWDEPARPASPAQPEAASSASAEKPAPAPVQPSVEHPADPALNKPRRVAAEGINPFPQWDEVVRLLQEKDPMLYTYLKKSKGYFDGTRVLIDGGKTFRDFIRANKDSQRLIKKLIAQVSGVAVPIGPYEPKAVHRSATNAEESLRRLEQLGVDVSIEESAKKKR